MADSNPALRVVGEWDHPQNVARDRAGSIHDDEKAKALGFRGAFVSARTHLNLFAPGLRQIYGKDWFEQGVISMEFRIGTLDREPARAVIEPAGESGARYAWLEDGEGREAARGEVVAGSPNHPTWLGRRDLSRGDDGRSFLRIDHIRPGQQFPTVDVTVGDAQVNRYMTSIETPLDWFTGPSPWGGPVACFGSMVSALGAPCSAYLRENGTGAVAIDGAIELRMIAGPVRRDTPYRASGEVIARGRSPRTEYIWYESGLDDTSGQRVAEMRMQLRFVVA